MCRSKTCNFKNFQLNQVVLILTLCFFWSLLAIPIAFFYLPNGNSSSDSKCSSAIELENSICYGALQSRLEDHNFSTSSGRVLVAINGSNKLQDDLGKLEFVDDDCWQVLVSFLCAYYYGGLCNEEGTFFPATAAECWNISTGACQNMWTSPGIELPQCDSLHLVNKSSHLADALEIVEYTSPNTTSGRTGCPATCAERFFCDTRTNMCVPSCPDWNTLPLNIVAFGDIMILMASILGMFCGFAIIIISIIRRKMIFTFPSVLVVYETISILIHTAIQIISFLDREELYCSSSNILESAIQSTPYCMISGMVQAAYIPLQFNIWWVSHMFILFWTVSHPFDAMKSSIKMRFLRIHIIIVVVGILLPAVSILGIIISDVINPFEFGTLGFGLIQSPPLFCTASSSTSYFYFIQLPNAVLLILGLTGLTLTIWTIHRKYGIAKSIKDKKKSPVTTAEIKLMVIVCYFMILEVVHFTGTSQTPDTQRELELYFECEQNGVNPDYPCSRSGFENPFGLIFFTVSYSLALLIPAVNLLFVIDLTTLKSNVRMFLKKFQRS